MKKSTRNILYALLTVSSLVFAAFIIVKGKNDQNLPELRERKGALAQDPEWPLIKAEVSKIQNELKKDPTNVKSLLQLSKAYMEESRVTGDYSYYNRAALDIVRTVLKKEPANLEATCFEAMIYLSQHRFAEGKAIAESAVKKFPYNSFVYGLLCDANVELGNYPAAVQAADKMVSIRPDIRSYSRVSYLREIHGDPKGAIEAIQMAISAGMPGQEDTEWARMVLGHLYEETNQLNMAEGVYNQSLLARPNYPFAMAGLGRVARYRKDYPAAIRYFEQAKDIISDGSFYESLVDLYQLNGQKDKAYECASITIDAYLADNISAGKDKDSGHYSDRDLALLYGKTGDFAKAYEHAKVEYERRPENIDACETLAWALYQQGKYGEAAPLMEKALRTQAQSPERLAKAGLILKANGQNEAGEALLAKAQMLKPYMDEPFLTLAAK